MKTISTARLLRLAVRYARKALEQYPFRTRDATRLRAAISTLDQLTEVVEPQKRRNKK